MSVRILRRLIGIALLIFMGQVLADDPAQTPSMAVFVSLTETYDLRISRVDLQQQKVISSQLITDHTNFPHSIDPHCRILFPTRTESGSQLTALNLLTGERHDYFETSSPVVSGEWLPDGRHIWSFDRVGTEPEYLSLVIDTVDGSRMELDPYSNDVIPAIDIFWSPDSHYAVFYGVEKSALLDTATGIFTPLPVGYSQRFLWSSDGRYLAALRYLDKIPDMEIIVTDVQTMTTYRQRPGEIHGGISIGWTPENELLFLARESLDVPEFQGYRWSPVTDTLAEIPVILAEVDLSYAARANSWSPDGTKLFYDDPEGRVHILNAVLGREIAAIEAPEYGGGYRGLRWSPDSRYVVSMNDNPKSFAFTDTVSNQTTTLDIEVDDHTFAELMDAWQRTPEPALFETYAATLWRLTFVDDKPEFRAEYTLPGAYLGALCYPEETG